MEANVTSRPDMPKAGTQAETVSIPELAYDEARLLYWLRQRNLGQFVITTTKVIWEEFRSHLGLKDGQVVYLATGEPVDGVTQAYCQTGKQGSQKRR